LEAALALDEYVNARDPLNPTGFGNLGKGYLALGRWDEAIASYRAAQRLSPGRIGIHYFIGVALLLKGDAPAALEETRREEYAILRLLGEAMVQHTLGEADASAAALAELVDNHGQEAAYNIAYTLAWRGDIDRAFEYLHQARDLGDPGLADILSEPLFASLQADSRWLPFLESIGKAPAQLDAIPFEVSWGSPE